MAEETPNVPSLLPSGAPQPVRRRDPATRAAIRSCASAASAIGSSVLGQAPSTPGLRTPLPLDAGLRAELAALRQERARRSAERKRLRALLRRTRGEAARLGAEVARLRETLAGARETLAAREAELAALRPAPAPAGPILEPAAEPAPAVAPARVLAVRSPIHDYWLAGQLASKLGACGASDPIEFVGERLARIARDEPTSIHPVLLAGARPAAFGAALADHVLRASVRNFRIHLLGGERAQLERVDTAAEVRRQLVALEAPLERWCPKQPYSLCILDHALGTLPDPVRVLARIQEALHPDGLLVLSEFLGDDPETRSPEGLHVLDRIVRLMPERLAHARSDAGADAGQPTPGVPELLALLSGSFFFEVFFAFGNLVDRFIGPALGPNFDPNDERDRRFIDQVARLDEGQIDAGLARPRHLFAALRTVPVGEPVVWADRTPELCTRPPASRGEEQTAHRPSEE